MPSRTSRSTRATSRYEFRLLSRRGRPGGRSSARKQIEGANADQVERSVESATIEILSGKDDRLLRRILLVADFGVDVPEDVRKGLGSFAGAHVTFDLTIAKPNAPVDVQEPADAEPYPG